MGRWNSEFRERSRWVRNSLRAFGVASSAAVTPDKGARRVNETVGGKATFGCQHSSRRGGALTMETLFGETLEQHPTEKPTKPARQRVLITVKAAPNPSVTYGETVCVAGVRLGDLGPTGWIRLYPINFRHLPKATEQFKKYDIVTVDCQPAGEARLESWRPNMSTLQVETHLPHGGSDANCSSPSSTTRCAASAPTLLPMHEPDP